MKFVLIHGFKASPESNFFPWLKDELRKLGHEVEVPALPHPESPDAEEWTKYLVDNIGAIVSRPNNAISHPAVLARAPVAQNFAIH